MSLTAYVLLTTRLYCIYFIVYMYVLSTIVNEYICLVQRFVGSNDVCYKSFCNSMFSHEIRNEVCLAFGSG